MLLHIATMHSNYAVTDTIRNVFRNTASLPELCAARTSYLHKFMPMRLSGDGREEEAATEYAKALQLALRPRPIEHMFCTGLQRSR